MPIVVNNTLNQIRSIASGSDDRVVKAQRLAEIIQKLGGYRWLGIYDVNVSVVSIISWSGPGAPEFPTFPVTKGLTSAAISSRQTVIVGDVRSDERYLTAFENTLSEMIVPVMSPDGRVIGTVDVESEKANAFSETDRQMVEQCVQAGMTVWLVG
jgi:GAF domain-containing protein